MNTLRRLKHNVKEIFSRVRMHWQPAYSVMLGKYNVLWDKRLSYLIREFDFVEYSEHIAKIGDTHIWIANFPSAFGLKYDKHFRAIPTNQQPQACRLTVKRVYDKLQKDMKSGVCVYNEFCGLDKFYGRPEDNYNHD